MVEQQPRLAFDRGGVEHQREVGTNEAERKTHDQHNEKLDRATADVVAASRDAGLLY